ncbi:MAG: LysR family transcriptional regulator [Oscillospiraceae bacterium]|nr:LysR family transcriptional regulator [Oscillospiraceae bacterium]MBR4692681.1 LysR family transcriptional regulator [Oscillospiraceae bacterium]
MEAGIQKYMAFVETADCGSFTKAAERLHYSQSGVSRMIRDLEEEWGVTLLERGKGGVKLSSDGQKLLPFARSVCAEQEKLRRQVDELSGLRSGLIRIGAPGGAAAQWLPGWIGSFRREYPGIDYELLVGDRQEIEGWLLGGRVDLGILTLPAPPELETVFLEQERLLAVLPAELPGAEGEVFPVSSFVDLPFLMPEKEKPGVVSQLLENCGIEPRVRFTAGDAQTILSLVERGLGVSILPETDLYRCGYKVETKRLDVPAYRSLGLALRSKKTASLAVKRFLQTAEKQTK